MIVDGSFFFYAMACKSKGLKQKNIAFLAEMQNEGFAF